MGSSPQHAAEWGLASDPTCPTRGAQHRPLPLVNTSVWDGLWESPAISRWQDNQPEKNQQGPQPEGTVSGWGLKPGRVRAGEQAAGGVAVGREGREAKG